MEEAVTKSDELRETNNESLAEGQPATAVMHCIWHTFTVFFTLMRSTSDPVILPAAEITAWMVECGAWQGTSSCV